jgi:nicotinate-nucleotide adenylyltransferase
MKIALYFGSFNPIHNGHLIIANHILNETDHDKLWFVISPQNPLKQSNHLLNEFDRLFLVQTAIEGDIRMRASDIEFHLPRPSYTINTLTYLKEKYPDDEFSVVMGSDSFSNIQNWKNADVLKKNYSILIYKRPGFEVTAPPNSNIQILQAPLLDISSSAIRALIKMKKSIRYLVPEKVREEIEKGHYYGKGIV